MPGSSGSEVREAEPGELEVKCSRKTPPPAVAAPAPTSQSSSWMSPVRPFTTTLAAVTLVLAGTENAKESKSTAAGEKPATPETVLTPTSKGMIGSELKE